MIIKELLGSGWEMKNRVIDWHVGLRFIDNDLLLVRPALAASLDRGGNKHAAGFFVISEIGLNLFLCAVSDALCHNSNL